MQQKNQFQNGYTFNRIINGCWQLSAEHCLQGRLDVKVALRAFHMLVDQGFTTFDCADIYTGVEEIIGEFVSELKRDGNYREEDIQILHVDGGDIVAIFVPMAERDQLPVYIGGDLVRGSYRRSGDGDYHCTQAERNAMLSGRSH